MRLVFGVLIGSLLLASCSSISEQDAQAKALLFIKQNVKFYAQQNSEASDVTEYAIDYATTQWNGDTWVVAAHISATLANSTKQNDLLVELDRKGNVISLNGKPVPKT